MLFNKKTTAIASITALSAAGAMMVVGFNQFQHGTPAEDIQLASVQATLSSSTGAASTSYHANTITAVLYAGTPESRLICPL
jgi:hypothetical protein